MHIDDVEEYSAVNDLPSHVYVYKNKILDQNVTGMVRPIPTPNARFFGIENAHLFREQFFRKRVMWVSVERRGTDKPEEREVRCVDGSVIVLKSPLNFTPQEGAVVQLFLGYRRKFADHKTAEKWEKEYKNALWI